MFNVEVGDGVLIIRVGPQRELELVTNTYRYFSSPLVSSIKLFKFVGSSLSCHQLLASSSFQHIAWDDNIKKTQMHLIDIYQQHEPEISRTLEKKNYYTHV